MLRLVPLLLPPGCLCTMNARRQRWLGQRAMSRFSPLELLSAVYSILTLRGLVLPALPFSGTVRREDCMWNAVLCALCTQMQAPRPSYAGLSSHLQLFPLQAIVTGGEKISPRELLRLALVLGRTRWSHHTPMADLSRAWELIGVCLYDGMCLVVDVAVLRRMLCHGALVRRPFSLLTSELFAGVRAVQHA